MALEAEALLVGFARVGCMAEVTGYGKVSDCSQRCGEGGKRERESLET